MKKVIIIGSPGAGKSTFARALYSKIRLPLYYLDMLWHKPDKTTVSCQEFDRRLAEILSLDKWIIDGNYSRTLESRLIACDTVFFLDFPPEVCLQGVNDRIGKPREDMPWTEEAVDEELISCIKSFSKRELPHIYTLLKKYNYKSIIIFKSREESEKYLEKMI